MLYISIIYLYSMPRFVAIFKNYVTMYCVILIVMLLPSAGNKIAHAKYGFA